MNRLRDRLGMCAALAISILVGGAPAIARAEASDVLFSAYAKMLGSRFATVTVTTDDKGRQTRSSAEFETIERIRITTETGGFVILPGATWMRTGSDGEWSKPPFNLGGMLKQLLPQSLDEMRAQARNIRDEGEKSVGGASLHAISYDVDMKVMTIAVSAHTTVYIDKEGRIVRSESDGVAMGKKSHTVQETRYDPSITVTAPNA